jgi:hypothetical protein
VECLRIARSAKNTTHLPTETGAAPLTSQRRIHSGRVSHRRQKRHTRNARLSAYKPSFFHTIKLQTVIKKAER